MKNKSIKSKITLFVIIVSTLIFSSILVYVNIEIAPDNEAKASFYMQQIIETKSSEISRWIDKKVIEYRTIATLPSVKSMDVRRITPIIEEITESHIKNGQNSEEFSFIGKNGFCWINSDATKDLIRYDEYMLAYESELEFIIGDVLTNSSNNKVILFYYPIKGYTEKKESLICFAVPLVDLESLVNTLQLYTGKTWIMNRDQTIITTNDNYLYSQYISEESLSKIDYAKINTADVFDVETKNGNGKLYVSPITSYSDWILCSVVSDKQLNKTKLYPVSRTNK